MQQDITAFADELRDYARSLGAELYGVASAAAYAERFSDKPAPESFVEGAQSIVVIGLPFEPGTMATVLKPELAALRDKAADQVGKASARPAGAERFFLDEENGAIVRDLTGMGYKLARFIRRAGWKSLHLPACKQNARFRTAPFYHMPAMVLAGMGTVGLNCSVITPEFGPRVFVTSIITDCPLPAGEPLAEELCNGCKLCVKNCPIEALDGKGDKNPFACASYGCCATCLAICPVGEA